MAVYFVGAGLGTPRSLTLEAWICLQQAQVVLYDALLSPRLLELTPPDCLRVAVGKRAGAEAVPQSEINRLLVAYGQQYQRVVRLKSGDPGLFGRLHQELDAVLGAGLEAVVIPGLSSALAAPLLAGLCLTAKDVSQSVAILSGHAPETLPWAAIAQMETLIFLMATRSLRYIAEQLLRQGRSPAEGLAILQWAGQPQQQFWFGTLESYLNTPHVPDRAPAVVVVGAIAQKRYPLASLDLVFPEFLKISPSAMSPLHGKTILVTRAAAQASDFTQQLTAAGATVLEMPTLEIVPPSSWQPLDQALAQLNTFDWLILTSHNAVSFFMERLQHHGKDSRTLAGLKIAVVGEKTAQTLSSYGLVADFTPSEFVADALVAEFPEPVAGLRFLFPRVEKGGRPVLVETFTAAGAEVVEVPAYDSRCPQTVDAQVLGALQGGQVDMVTFTSSKTVKHFCQLVGAQAAELLQNVQIASIGPQTSQTCRELLGRVDTEATEHTLEGLLQALLRIT
ncbi:MULTISPECIES: uroporphyrinogen-III C-methyltransferase [unclassified Thermosynechococcus]|uniref:uroporphyrinogen-III C-methyltransferase n=1 Tax=unclassified Thermosynechococcus TaxID=2622553 RepID=UPI002873A3BE|nr:MULTISPECIES: uroporphyrinogen-III C-methyltransferase [unclassified Thermosynechococcus]WNC31618.1 uroporphyrinogen-III C-methyltransferase [Thermosynechococcus sp. PKX95]WNC34142.1 uroporphyrinogen-III C-methyltransferase [Thermosynechococcus sp. PKX91]WNC36665.1 uroporphyrinogen-III C-methyltransferase [Thermosynechococcus sp. WL11]WNC39186.1 uroporphyrinogen-III C-methyltransferase [Thermosynechococcus sp. WL17]WNC41707.1 uroporphyrinogen-III C-methyltransferase [Thermosynechococcus sp.